MRIKSEVKYDKALLVDEKMIYELIYEVERIGEKISFKAKLKNDDEVEFDDIEELLNYDNYYARKICWLEIKGIKDVYDYIYINLNSSNRYTYDRGTASVQIESDDQDKVNLIKQNIQDIFNNHTLDKRYCFFVKSKLWDVIYYSLLIIIFVMALVSLKIQMLSLAKVEIITAVILIIMTITKKPYKKKKNNIFEPVVFCIGREIEEYKKKERIRSNFFWTVIVGGGIAVVLEVAGFFL